MDYGANLFFLFWGQFADFLGTLQLDIVKLTRLFMSELAESGANWIYLDANSICFDQTCPKKC